jgi:hypothetical protein
MACFFTKIFSTDCFRRTSGCASIGAILNRLSTGHGQNPIGTGGSSFCETPGGTGFWHELYSVRGGFKAMYVDVQRPTGFLRFANPVPAKGSFFSARERLHRGGVANTPAPYTETELY